MAVSNLKSEIGHKNGVGKKEKEWLGISTKICTPHAKRGIKGFFRINHTKPNTAKKIIKLCVILYKECTNWGMLAGSGKPSPHSGPETKPSTLEIVKTPKDNKSGAIPKPKAQKYELLF